MDDDFGGYPSEMFVEKVLDNLKCVICLAVSKNPKQCKNGHIYCTICIDKHLQQKGRKFCPTCKISIPKFSGLSDNLAVKNIIEKMVVTCDQCEWIGQLCQRPTHLDSHLMHINAEITIIVDLDVVMEVDLNVAEEIVVDHESFPATFFDGFIKGKEGFYVGQLKKRHHHIVRHGEGVEFCDKRGKRSIYSGEFKNNQKCGHGVVSSEENDQVLFSGDWNRNMKHGMGIQYFKNGDSLHGSWRKGRRHGTGLLMHADGSDDTVLLFH
jgi:hypothetical protein